MHVGTIDKSYAGQSTSPGADHPNCAVIRLLLTATRVLIDDPISARAFIDEASSLLDGQREVIKASPVKGGLAPWQMNKVKKYIDENLQSSIRLKDLGNLAHLSTTYFSRAFRRSFGQAPHSYLTVRRLESAMALILEGDQALSEIAQACGFSDQAHLTRLFKRSVGNSPAAWRRENAARQTRICK